MAYDERLAERLRNVLSGIPGLEEKKMFGGIAYMVNGNMCVGIIKRDLMIRVAREHHATLVAKPHADVMKFTGRPMKGFITITPDGLRTSTQLRTWGGHALEYVQSLPPKKALKKRPSKKRA